MTDYYTDKAVLRPLTTGRIVSITDTRKPWDRPDEKPLLYALARVNWWFVLAMTLLGAFAGLLLA
jgi:hypothetical protein